MSDVDPWDEPTPEPEPHPLEMEMPAEHPDSFRTDQPEALEVVIRVEDLWAGFRGPALNEDGDRAPLDVGALVIEHAAQLLLARQTDDGAWGLRRRVEQITDDLIRDRLRSVIHQALSSPAATYQLAGEPVTLEARILQIAKAELGRKDSRRHGEPQRTIVEQLVHEHIGEEVNKALRLAVAQATQQAQELIRERAAQFLAAEVAKGTGRAF